MAEKSCLIANNLINSVDWFRSAPPSIIKPEKGGDGKTTWKGKARKDLENLLLRKGFTPNEAIKNGLRFEAQVYKYSQQKVIPEHLSENFFKVCAKVAQMEFNRKGSIRKTIGEDNCYFFGRYDALGLNHIVDLKTTAKYREGKYLKSFQHKLYCYISKFDYFEYVIAEWDEYPKIKAVHLETYEVLDRRDLECEVEDHVYNTLDTLKSAGLWGRYKNDFCLYY